MQKIKTEITKFVLVGAANFLLTLLVFTTMLKILAINYLVSLGTSWVVGTVFSFMLNFSWVFRPEHQLEHQPEQTMRFKARFVKFFLAGLVSILLNMLALSLIVEHSSFDPFFVQLALIPLVVVFNFSTAKFWSLRPSPHMHQLKSGSRQHDGP